MNRVRYVTLLRPQEPARVSRRRQLIYARPRGLALRLHFGGVVVHQLLGDARRA